MFIKKKIITTVFSIFILFTAGPVFSAIRVVAAIPDLGSIAASIGGDKIEVSSIAKGNANPHSVEVFPSYMAKVSRAAVYLKVGLGLDQWSDAIIDGSRNGSLLVVDCSAGISVLEKPVKVDASMGDVHPFGNPHYWLDPRNGAMAAQTIAEALEKADPANAAVYAKNLDRFKAEVAARFAAWLDKMKPLDGRNMITYHSSWPYFANAFHLSIVEHVEPFPGIPPTGNHLAHLVEVIRKEHVALIMQEPYFADDGPNFLKRQTGVPVFKFAPSCSDVGPASYLDHFDAIVNQLISATGGK
ncbi:MAG TPA: metal ABC transporter substrate-binding protein [Chitinivibrionales bacterium]|nr:metal ABC transporter substrate-binding protein [Chitinivibrionales bacterium]